MDGSGAYSRTRKSIRNSIVAVSLQVLTLLIGFWSRKIFLDHLGAEVLGLNTTASSLLGFLNLAELGIGSAIAVTLYKPLFDDDKASIREIVALQGWMYKIIAFVIIVAAAILSLFFPAIFSKSELPLWYAYASFGVLLFGSLLSYFFNYKEVVLSADQNEYKIQYSFRVVMVLKLLAQVFALKYFSNPYIWWLVFEALFAVIATISLNVTIYRNYPYLKGKVESPSLLRHKYPGVVTKVKQMFFHKIGSFVLTQTSPLILYAFASLSMVAYYGNYLVLTSNLGFLLAAMFTGLGGSVGNMVAEGDRNLIMKVFRELFSSRFWIVATCCICLWHLTEPFITLWLGSEYLLDRTTLLLMISIFYVANTRQVVDTFIGAYGLFRDIWAPVAESVLNLGLSIALGSIYGLNGILTGVLVSQIVIILLWKPYFLFRSGMKEPLGLYVGLYLKHLALFALIAFASRYLASSVDVGHPAGFLEFLIRAAVLFAGTLLSLGAVLYCVEPGMRSFFARLLNMLKITHRAND